MFPLGVFVSFMLLLGFGFVVVFLVICCCWGFLRVLLMGVGIYFNSEFFLGFFKSLRILAVKF